MRKSKAEAAETKARILKTAARLFRERGLDAVSVADVMSAADLTVGGFYRHFESKEALVSAAIEAASAESDANRAAGRLAPGYLSAAHRENPGLGCPVSALVSDIARQTASTRAAFTEAVRGLVARLEPESGDHKSALRRAVELVGAIALSRAVDDTKLADEILRSVR
jgi:TetR/AcrR family transcriptional repressor of nem operon